ncbi:uncharacterized protein LOC116177614 [Photinus pyralis]|uniref:uncharacterized protein LOC116177614 n=1 Tax=Photinus pyralis TaxID=7054 RepID=UPI0012673866|nr:uncharacterized protein LOC116177614 [Photinus pyralis]
MELQLLASLYFMWEIVDSIQQFDTLTDEILSFLFKYHVSKLTRTEAAQVEMLINVITAQRPIFNACDIFVVGTKLFATVCGTIVTYVMVALQFHKTWINAYK